MKVTYISQEQIEREGWMQNEEENSEPGWYYQYGNKSLFRGPFSTESEARGKAGEELTDNLAHFSGTEQYHKFGLTNAVCTDGALYLAEKAGAFWLLDEIALAQRVAKIHQECDGLQFWNLTVTGSSAMLQCQRDSGCKPCYSKDIPLTDFPLPKIDIWVGFTDFGDGKGVRPVLYLPSEH